MTPSIPHINRADHAHTIYPPAAQLLFRRRRRASSRRVLAMKLAMVGLEAAGHRFACCACSRSRGLPRRARADLRLEPARRLGLRRQRPCRCARGRPSSPSRCWPARRRRQRLGRRRCWAPRLWSKFLPAAVAPALWRRAAAGACRPALRRHDRRALRRLCRVGWQRVRLPAGYAGEEGLRRAAASWLRDLADARPPLPPPARRPPVRRRRRRSPSRRWPPGSPSSAARIDGPVAMRRAHRVALLAAAHRRRSARIIRGISPGSRCPAASRRCRSIIWLSVAPVLLYLDPFHDQFSGRRCVYLPSAALAAVRSAPRLRAPA